MEQHWHAARMGRGTAGLNESTSHPARELLRIAMHLVWRAWRTKPSDHCNLFDYDKTSEAERTPRPYISACPCCKSMRSSFCVLLACAILLWGDSARAGMPMTLVFAHYFPPRADYGSDLRLSNIIKSSVRSGHSVFFICQQPGRPTDQEALDSLIGPNRTLMMDAEHRTNGHTAVLLHLPPGGVAAFFIPVWFWFRPSVFELYAPLFERAYPSALLVSLSDDCHFARQTMLSSHSPHSPAWFLEHETAIYRASDLIVFVTERDLAVCSLSISALREESWVPGQKKARVVRTGPQSPPQAQSTLTKVFERTGFVFLGKSNNPTNHKSVQRFLSSVWPLARQAMPSAQLFIVGEACRDSRCNWLYGTPFPNQSVAESAGIRVVGFDESLQKIDGRIALVMPIFSSTGVNTKFFRATERGLPVVISMQSAASLNVSHHDCSALFVCKEEPKCWVDRMALLASDDALWQRMSRASHRLGQSLYNENIEGTDLKQLLGQLREEWDAKRRSVT